MKPLILRDASQWDAFKNQYARDNELPGGIAWGNGPQAFPCSVAAVYLQETHRVLTYYVYVDDARDLLAVSLAGDDEPLPAASSELQTQLDDLRARHSNLAKLMREFAASSTAHLRVLVDRGLDTGFFKGREWYEQAYAAELAWIDQQNEEKRQSLDPKDLYKPE